MAFRGSVSAVIARLFKLVSQAGKTVGIFGPSTLSTAFVPGPGFFLSFDTGDPLMANSALFWTNPPAGVQSTLALIGPYPAPHVAGNSPPRMYLTSEAAFRVLTLYSGSVAPAASGQIQMFGLASGTSIDVTADTINLQGTVTIAGVQVKLNPTTSVELNGRTARLLVDRGNTVVGGPTLVGPIASTVLPGSAITLNLKAGDLCHISGTMQMGCAVAGGGAFMRCFANGVDTGAFGGYSAGAAGDTVHVAMEPRFYSPAGAGNVTFDARYEISGTGPSYGFFRCSLMVLVYSYK